MIIRYKNWEFKNKNLVALMLVSHHVGNIGILGLTKWRILSNNFRFCNRKWYYEIVDYHLKTSFLSAIKILPHTKKSKNEDEDFYLFLEELELAHSKKILFFYKDKLKNNEYFHHADDLIKVLSTRK